MSMLTISYDYVSIWPPPLFVPITFTKAPSKNLPRLSPCQKICAPPQIKALALKGGGNNGIITPFPSLP